MLFDTNFSNIVWTVKNWVFYSNTVPDKFDIQISTGPYKTNI